MSKKRLMIVLISILLLLAACYILYTWGDAAKLRNSISLLLSHPEYILLMTLGYGLSFVLKAKAWQAYVLAPVRQGTYIAGLFHSLLINHIFPIKIGDLARAAVLTKHNAVSWDMALHSVVVMRLLDMMVLGMFAGVGSFVIGWGTPWVWLVVLLLLVIVIVLLRLIVHRTMPAFLSKHIGLLTQLIHSPKGIWIILLTAGSWILEAAVLYGIILALQLHFSPLQAIWLNSLTVAGQTFHLTPGGIGTYETTFTLGMGALGFDWTTAINAALLTHGYKFVFAYAVGIYAWIREPLELPLLWRKAANKGDLN